MTDLLSQYNADSKEYSIYSKYTYELVLKGKVEDIYEYGEIERGIRRAERIAAEQTKVAIQEAIISVKVS